MQQAPVDAPFADAKLTELRAQLERALRRICPPWLADRRDDLVQVAVMRLLDVARRREKTPDFSASYCWRVAYSALIDEIRRLRRRGEVALEDEDGVLPAAPRAGPERVAASRELARELRSCLVGLIRPRRVAVTLHLQGYAPAEAAPILGWKVKRVYNQVHRGLQDLRDCLTAKGLGP